MYLFFFLEQGSTPPRCLVLALPLSQKPPSLFVFTPDESTIVAPTSSLVSELQMLVSAAKHF